MRPSDPCPIADHVFPRRVLVAVMAGIVHQPVPTMASPQMINLTSLGFQAAGSAGGISPPAAHRTVRKPLDLHGSSQPLPCHLAMTVDAESDRSSRLPGWRPPSLSWVIRFAPRSLQALRHYYRMIRPRHAHRYFPPSCFALIRFSLRSA